MRLFSLNRSLPETTSSEDLRIVNSEINRLERIVKDFLQFARPAEPNRGRLSVASLVHDVRLLLNGEMQRRAIHFETTASEDLFVLGDRPQLQQVLINLVQNAADSISSGGRITLRARAGAAQLNGRSGPVITLEVTDTGKGIPSEMESRVFDPFFSTKEGGTGLGLPIAARIVEKHDGIIHYSSQRGLGTTFSIVLPASNS
jgi:signal transduction histidine kinase